MISDSVDISGQPIQAEFRKKGLFQHPRDITPARRNSWLLTAWGMESMTLKDAVYLLPSVQKAIVIPRRKREHVLSVASEFARWERSCADLEFAKMFPLLRREDHDGNVRTGVGLCTFGIPDDDQWALCDFAAACRARRKTFPVILRNRKSLPILRQRKTEAIRRLILNGSRFSGFPRR